MEATGAPYLGDLGGHAIQPCQGDSLLALLRGRDWRRDVPIFFEHEGNAAIRFEQFKLVRLHGSDWELYDFDVDRTELVDIRYRDPKQARLMLDLYGDWARRTGVRPWNEILPRLLSAWNIASVDG